LAGLQARSGETEDISISHLATGLGGSQVNAGFFHRSEERLKWDERLRTPGRARGRHLRRWCAAGRTWWCAENL